MAGVVREGPQDRARADHLELVGGLDVANGAS